MNRRQSSSSPIRGPAAWLLCAGLFLACLTPFGLTTSEYVMKGANRGTEEYSAWFGDSDGRVLYFGLSPFWQLWWQTGGDPRADLQTPGEHMIGRFDMRAERFLPPLRVQVPGSELRSSVWDVLSHSNGKIYFTTYFEEIGSIDFDGSGLQIFNGIGVGFNELYEGPRGRLYVTRYSDSPHDVNRQTYGAVVVLTPHGRLVREIRVESEGGYFTAPKSLAVDPASGEIWVNTDTFLTDGSVVYETIRLSPQGKVLSRYPAPPELLFMRFDEKGRGYFAEDHDGDLRLRVRRAGETEAVIQLGPRAELDFIQDIHFSEDGAAILSFWSGRVTLVRRSEDAWEHVDVQMVVPKRCKPPKGRSLLYTTVSYGNRLYGTLFCGPTVLGADVPPPLAWTQVMPEVAAAPAALDLEQLAERIEATVDDAAARASIEVSLAEALPEQTADVLFLLGEEVRIESVCGVPFIEWSEDRLRRYIARSKHALGGPIPEELESTRRECLAHLIEAERRVFPY